MDIEFIQEQHRDNIFKIMELCNCDMAQAYELYNNNGCNVQNAVQAKFNAFTNNSQMSHNYQEPINHPPSYGNNNRGNINNYGGNFDNFGAYSDSGLGQDEQYESYKIFKQSGMNFGKRYAIRRQNSGIVKGVLSIFKSSENGFKKKLQEYIGKRINLNLPNGSLSEAFESILKQKFPLVVHALDFNKQVAVVNNLKKIYTDQMLMEMFNVQFRSYGLNIRQYDLEPYFKQFIDIKNDANSLIIFRINIIEEIILVSKIPLMKLTSEQVKKKLKQVKHNCINLQMEQSHHQKRYQEELMGNFDYQKPLSFAEQRKLKQDRQIRRKQQQEFYAAMQPKKQQQKPSSNTNITSTYSKPLQNKPSPVKKDLRAEAQQQRKKIRDRLKIYESDGEGMIAIKLRLPSSQQMKLYVHSSEPAGYLYEYILSRENDLGFENDETKRVFDIIEPYDKINLSQRKNEKLGKIFEGETMLSLVVNEKLE